MWQSNSDNFVIEGKTIVGHGFVFTANNGLHSVSIVFSQKLDHAYITFWLDDPAWNLLCDAKNELISFLAYIIKENKLSTTHKAIKSHMNNDIPIPAANHQALIEDVLRKARWRALRLIKLKK